MPTIIDSYSIFPYKSIYIRWIMCHFNFCYLGSKMTSPNKMCFQLFFMEILNIRFQLIVN